jgi:hypothetical protein
MGGNWRDGFQWAHQIPDTEPEGPGLVWRETGAGYYWSGSWAGLPRGTVMLESRTQRWIAYVRLDEPPGLSPISDVGRYPTADEAMVAVDEAWASRDT